MVLATDEVFTYVIFNYADMQWTSHTEAGGDTTGGEGGVTAFVSIVGPPNKPPMVATVCDRPADCVPQVGFNAGNGTRSFEYYPYSQRSTIRDLVGRGWANNFPGRHIFRIDENIMLGTCNKDIGEYDRVVVVVVVFAVRRWRIYLAHMVDARCAHPRDEYYRN